MIMNFKNIFTTLLLMLIGISMNAQPTAQEWNKDVVGWNLGNQLECSAPGQDGESMAIGMADNSIKAETTWGNPVVTKRTIKAVKDAEKKIIRCSVVVGRDQLEILLSDTGNGIPADKREWVFGIYNTTTQEQGGAGIGLYIVKTRVDSLKGKVSVVDSEFGTIGTTIKIELPFKK